MTRCNSNSIDGDIKKIQKSRKEGHFIKSSKTNSLIAITLDWSNAIRYYSIVKLSFSRWRIFIVVGRRNILKLS